VVHEEFYMSFKILCEYYSATPSEALSEIYWQAFKDWSFEDFKRACSMVMQTRVYSSLPKIPEITEGLYGKVEDAAAIAWQSLMNTLRDHGYWESVVFEDGAIGRAVEAMGGWVVVSGWTIEEWRMRRKEFDALYLANLRRGNNEPVKLTGVFEVNNGGQFEEFIPKSVTVKSQNRAVEPKLKLLSN